MSFCTSFHPPFVRLTILCYNRKKYERTLDFMKRYDFTITSDRGLHAQPVAALAVSHVKCFLCYTRT